MQDENDTHHWRDQFYEISTSIGNGIVELLVENGYDNISKGGYIDIDYHNYIIRIGSSSDILTVSLIKQTKWPSPRIKIGVGCAQRASYRRLSAVDIPLASPTCFEQLLKAVKDYSERISKSPYLSNL